MTTVLLTGANRGIGLEFARQYLTDGAEVIACCRTPDKAESLKELGGKLAIEQLDVTDSDSIARLAARLKDRAVDILINNAGVFGPDRQSADDSDAEGYLETFRINTVAPLVMAQAFKDNLVRGTDKKLVVITSKMGSISDSSGGSLAYRASKAALNMIMNGVAKAWSKEGISVGILHPGWVQTDMGGPSATITVEQSVKGLKARIAQLGPRMSGKFYDYQGKEILW